jgi:hypothetical protein
MAGMQGTRYGRKGGVLAVLVALGVAAYQLALREEVVPGAAPQVGLVAVEEAYAARRSGVWVELTAEVSRLLADDDRGSRHQRFVVRLASGQTVLVAHNIDLAPRVPVAEGESVRLRGRYEWNERGGVLHWTHHDPDGGGQEGWVEHQGRRYR